MKKIIGVIICLVIGISCVLWLNVSEMAGKREHKIDASPAPGPDVVVTSEQRDPFIEERNTFSYQGKKLQYLLILPAGYQQAKSPWPMILFLHGASGRGEDLNLVKRYGPPLIAEQQSDFPFIVLAPQCPEKEYWTDNGDTLAALLDDILPKYHIDRERVYLTGISMGGNGAWQLANQYPEYFAAAAPLAASPALPKLWLQGFTSMPIWAFHGEKDTVCPLQDDEVMIRALRRQGAAPRFTVLPGQGHSITDVYKNRELYDWFLTNTRRH